MRWVALLGALVPAVAMAQPAPPPPAMQALQQTVIKLTGESLEWQAKAIELQARVADLEKQLADAKKEPAKP